MERGLSQAQAETLLQTYGRNEIVTKQRSVFSLLLSQLPTPINGILTIAAIISLAIGNILDGVFIIAILLINALFGFIQEFRAEQSLAKLKTFVTSLSRVIRDEKEIQISTSKLVPGDVVVLSEGERVPADGKILATHHMEIDESILTGESLPVIKKEHDVVLSGTLVVKGNGRILVEKTGMHTRFGIIATTLTTVSPDATPLQQQLRGLGRVLSLLAITVAFLIVPLGLAKGQLFFPLTILAISIAVAAIPEGLPTVITIALAIGTQRMAKKHAVVRQMQAIETLGAVQVLLIDKTGTLTKNSMEVKKHWVPTKETLPLLLKACVVGNTAALVKQVDGSDTFDVIGDKTDGALLLFAKKFSSDFELLKKEGTITDEYVFDPRTKTVTTVVALHQEALVFVRGAPETVVGKSRLTNDDKKAIQSLFESYANEGLRVIAFGKKTMATHSVAKERHELEQNLEFLGFVGIWDPARDDARHAVVEAKRAGVSTIMVTGDNELTALAIAKVVGLIEEDEDVVTGEELATLSDEQLRGVLTRVRIFARTSPEDKLRLVELFKKEGFIVGVTGDGVNDALALRRADVGIAFGTGTDVAKEASDIVLANDAFATIVRAIEEGRTIYNNIVKAVVYLLAGNLSELALVFGATLLGIPPPLLPTQILWINLVTDSLPALALAADAKHPNTLSLAPRDPHMPILTKNRIKFIGGIGLGLATLLLALFTFLLRTGSELYARTIIFNLLVIFHVGIAFLVRRGPVRGNLFLVWSVVVILLLQILITFHPSTQSLFRLGF